MQYIFRFCRLLRITMLLCFCFALSLPLHESCAAQSMAEYAKSISFSQEEREFIDFLKNITSYRAVEQEPDFQLLSADKKPIMKEHLTLLYRIDGLAEAYTLEMRNAKIFDLIGVVSDQTIESMRAQVASSFLNSLRRKGRLRLSDQAARDFFKFGAEVSARMDARNCVAFHFGTEPLDRQKWHRATYQQINQMSKDEARNFYATSRQAIAAELHDYPYPRTLNASEKLLAEQALLNAMLAYDKQHPQERFMEIMAHPESYSYEKRCKAGITLNELIYSMPGHAGQLLRTFSLMHVK